MATRVDSYELLGNLRDRLETPAHVARVERGSEKKRERERASPRAQEGVGVEVEELPPRTGLQFTLANKASADASGAAVKALPRCALHVARRTLVNGPLNQAIMRAFVASSKTYAN